MRGKVHVLACFFPLCRITPAYAGKREEAKNYLRVEQDHPRLCGEKCGKAVGVHQGVGSPPPMRGKESLSKGQRDHFGITPAYAGKSQKSKVSDWVEQDHPRLCGEKRRTMRH